MHPHCAPFSLLLLPACLQEVDVRLQALLGEVNQGIIRQAMQALTTGDVQGLG